MCIFAEIEIKAVDKNLIIKSISYLQSDMRAYLTSSFFYVQKQVSVIKYNRIFYFECVCINILQKKKNIAPQHTQLF